MLKKVLITVSLTVILLSACGGNAPTEAAVPTTTVTQTRIVTTVAASATPKASPTATATLETPIPTNPPDCLNQSTFVLDVTIPDNTPVNAGNAFTKIWRIKNTGSCVWGPDYRLVYYSEERMGAPESLPMPVTFPNETADISLTLVAPATSGTYRGNFVVLTPAGERLKIDNDSRLWVTINVTGSVAANTTGTAATNTTGTPPATGTAGTPISGLAPAKCAFTTSAANVAEAINAINTYRAQNGLSAYTINDQLTIAAQAHANDMACNKLFAHNGSDGSTPQSRVIASGYIASSVSENAYGSYPPLSGQGAVTWWANDQTDIRHNQNLLSTKFVAIGVGYAFFDNYGYYVVVFAAP